jgi:hypothetical protein
LFSHIKYDVSLFKHLETACSKVETIMYHIEKSYIGQSIVKDMNLSSSKFCFTKGFEHSFIGHSQGDEVCQNKRCQLKNTISMSSDNIWADDDIENPIDCKFLRKPCQQHCG